MQHSSLRHTHIQHNQLPTAFSSDSFYFCLNFPYIFVVLFFSYWVFSNFFTIVTYTRAHSNTYTPTTHCQTTTTIQQQYEFTTTTNSWFFPLLCFTFIWSGDVFLQAFSTFYLWRLTNVFIKSLRSFLQTKELLQVLLNCRNGNCLFLIFVHTQNRLLLLSFEYCQSWGSVRKL